MGEITEVRHVAHLIFVDCDDSPKAIWSTNLSFYSMLSYQGPCPICRFLQCIFCGNLKCRAAHWQNPVLFKCLGRIDRCSFFIHYDVMVLQTYMLKSSWKPSSFGIVQAQHCERTRHFQEGGVAKITTIQMGSPTIVDSLWTQIVSLWLWLLWP